MKTWCLPSQARVTLLSVLFLICLLSDWIAFQCVCAYRPALSLPLPEFEIHLGWFYEEILVNNASVNMGCRYLFWLYRTEMGLMGQKVMTWWFLFCSWWAALLSAKAWHMCVSRPLHLCCRHGPAWENLMCRIPQRRTIQRLQQTLSWLFSFKHRSRKGICVHRNPTL